MNLDYLIIMDTLNINEDNLNGYILSTNEKGIINVIYLCHLEELKVK